MGGPGTPAAIEADTARIAREFAGDGLAFESLPQSNRLARLRMGSACALDVRAGSVMRGASSVGDSRGNGIDAILYRSRQRARRPAGRASCLYHVVRRPGAQHEDRVRGSDPQLSSTAAG